jgi:hypothetical protein
MVSPQREIKIPEESDFLPRRVGSLRGILKILLRRVFRGRRISEGKHRMERERREYG